MRWGLVAVAVGGVVTSVVSGSVAPGRGPAQTAASVAALDSFSLQAAPGSAQPHLSTTGDGQVVLSWLEPGEARDSTRLRMARWRPGSGRAWTAPQTVAEGTRWFVNWADVPAVVPVTDTTWAAHWLERTDPKTPYAYDVRVVLSQDRGRTWSAPVTPHDDGTPTEHGFVSVFPWPDGSGSVGLTWLDGRAMAPAAGAGVHDGHGSGNMALRAARLAADGAVRDSRVLDARVCECCPTAALSTPEGQVVIAYRDRGDDETRDIHLVRHDGGWQRDRVAVPDHWRIAACPVNGPALARAGDDIGLAWFTAEGDRPRVQVAFSRDAGATWSAGTVIDAGRPLGRIGLAGHPAGGVAATWIEAESAGATVRVRRVRPDGTMGPSLIAARVASSRLSGYPRIVTSGDAFVLAWVGEDGRTGGREDGRRTRVRTARLPVSAVP